MQAAIGFKTNQKKAKLAANELDPTVSLAQLSDLQNKHTVTIVKLKEAHAKELREVESKRTNAYERRKAAFEKQINYLKKDSEEALYNISAEKTLIESELADARKENLILTEKYSTLKEEKATQEKELRRLNLKYKTAKIETAHRQSLLLTTIRRAAEKNRSMSAQLVHLRQNKFKLLYHSIVNWFKDMFRGSNTK